MRYFKYAFWMIFWAVTFAFLHYTLPQRDVARIVETEVRRVDLGENTWFWAAGDSGGATGTINRDVRFINTVPYGGSVMVYRNEDTGWGWPPYFKLDSSNLQTEAADLVSGKEAPKWVVITHYGWRNEVFSIFPNAVGVRPTNDPEKLLIPYFNIFVLIILAGITLGFYRLTQWFKRTSIDPIIDDIGETWEAVDDYADEKRGRFGSWIDSWTGKPRL